MPKATPSPKPEPAATAEIPAVALPSTVEHWPIARAVEYARNARTHTDAQIAKIARSIQEFGFTNPILVDENDGILAGHGRLAAARSLGLEQVPCIVLTHLSDAQKRAYVIADNRLAEEAGWDADVLMSELQILDGEGFDLDLTGMDTRELDRLLPGPSGPGGGDPDPTADEVAPCVQTGDLWQLGPHRLLCGDSTNPDDVARLLDGAKPHIMVTDPPYGVNYDPAWRNVELGQRTQRTGKVENDDRADWTEVWQLFPGNVAYVWHSSLHTLTVAASLERAGFELRSHLIWAKNRFKISRGNYHWQHEPCWYAVKSGVPGGARWNGARDQGTILPIETEDAADAVQKHGTQKPVQAMRIPLENNTKRGDAVYKPFCGFGTTIIACQQIARVCFAMELSPEYVESTIRRWETFTAQTAVLLDPNGEKPNLEEVRAARQNAS